MRAASAAVLLILCLAPPARAASASASQAGDAAETAARARRAMEQQQYEEAAALYAALVKSHPEHPGLRFNLGLALHSAGRHERAAAELERVVSRQPDFTSAWLILAMARLKLGDAEAALEPLERVVAREPRNAIARLELADARLTLGHAEEAARQFEVLTQLEPASAKAWLGTGRSYSAAARQAFEQLEKIAPDSAHWAALIARSRASQQQYRSAFALYRLALSRDPALRGIHAALAEIYRRTGHHDWAEEAERRARAEPPPDCRAEPLACEFAAGRYRELMARLAGVTSPEGLYWRSLAASELALQAFARLEALPASPELHAARAGAYRVRGLHDLSIKEWEAALRLAPGDRRLEAELAQSYWLNGDYEVARPLLEKAVAHEPRSPRLNVALGDTLLHLQRPDEAIVWLEKGLALAPDLPGTRAALARSHIPARAYTAAGHSAEGARFLERAQALAAEAEVRRQRTADEQQIGPPDP